MGALEEWIAEMFLVHSLNLLRFSADVQGKIIALMGAMSKELAGKLGEGEVSGYGKQRLAALLRESNAVIASHYSGMESESTRNLLGMTRIEADYTAKVLTQGLKIELGAKLPPATYLEKLVGDTLIKGASSADWWKRQALDTQFRFASQVRLGAAQGETTSQIVARVVGTSSKAVSGDAEAMPGILKTSEANARALVHSSAQAVANAARLASFQQNADLIECLVWLSTLDSHTCLLCAMRDLHEYPRVTATFDTDADKYSSNEIDPSQQQSDTRLGNFRTSGAIKGEASCGTYSSLLAALLRRDFTAGGVTAAQNTIASGVTGLTRSAGSWLADGHRAGTVVRIGGFLTTGAANNGKNFFVTSATALKLTGQFMDGSAMTVKVEGDPVTVTATGKRSFTPLTGHTTDWFTAEVQDPGIAVNRCFIDQLVSKVDIAVQPNGITSMDFTLMGKLEGVTTPAAYFNSPAATPGTGKFSGATAMLSVAGIPSQICTGMSLSLDGQVKIDPVIGSKFATAASRGKVLGSGQFTVLMQDSAYIDYFKQEVELPLAYAMAASTAPLAEVMTIAMGRIKITSAKVDDGEKNKIVTCAFDILRYQGTDAQHEATTVAFQDTSLV